MDPMAGIIHMAAWRSRAFEHNLNEEELQATFPADVAAQLNLSADLVISTMPGIVEMSEGLESLIN